MPKLKVWFQATAATWAAFFVLFATPYVIAAMPNPMRIWTEVERVILFAWIWDFESLAGGLATLAAAVVGALALWADSERKNAARCASLKSLLGLRLGDGLSYCEDCAAYLNALFGLVPFGGGISIAPTTSPSLPDLPETVVGLLSDISAVARRGDAERVADALHLLQLQRARIEGVNQSLLGGSTLTVSMNLTSRLAEALYLHAVLSDLFPWIRRERPDLPAPLGLAQISTSRNLLRYWSAEEEEAYEKIVGVLASNNPLKV